MSWMISNAGTIIVSAALLIIVSLIIKSMIKKRRNGQGSCGGNCSNCHGGCCR